MERHPLPGNAEPTNQPNQRRTWQHEIVKADRHLSRPFCNQPQPNAYKHEPITVNLELKTPVNPGEVYFRVQGVKIKCPKSEEFSGINT